MIDFNFVENCSGCGACKNICPVNAISLVSDKMQLWYPEVDKTICVNCNKCDKVCPHINASGYKEKSDRGYSWLYVSPNSDAKHRSSSGGAFYELAVKTIENGGYVCGCVWNDDMQAEHILSNNIADIQRMQGSKYVQSNMKNCYAEVLSLLKQDKKVLFSGTPCQITAIHSYVVAESPVLRKHLTTVGLICHGVSAPETWASYKRYLEKKYKSRLIAVNFRDKSKEGYKKCYCKFIFESGKVIYLPTFLPSSPYIEATLVYNLALRKSCHSCDCKGINSACDIILGDWYARYEGKYSLGTSCIVAFTEQGRNVTETYLDNIEHIDYAKIVEANGFIESSVQMAINRENFINNFNDDIWNDVEKYYPPKYKVKKILCNLGLYDFIKGLSKRG